MTLVFSCDYGNGPMLVADTMLSSNKLPKDDFITPGGDIEEAVATKLGIHGHSSKIACFDTFAIGWAGKKSTADSTIGHIRSFHEKQWWNRKELHRVLDRETKSGEVSFILHEIALGETFKTVERRVFGKHLAQGEGSNQILSIGSGAKAVQELLMESPRADHRETLKHSFSLNKPLRSSIEDYLFGISKLITSEASWWASHNCGGMYECCRPELGNLLNGNFGFQRFKFLNNYSLYLWNIREATLEDAKWNPR